MGRCLVTTQQAEESQVSQERAATAPQPSTARLRPAASVRSPLGVAQAGSLDLWTGACDV